MCKILLKDAYFSVSLSQKFQMFVSFKLKDLFCQSLCLLFDLGQAPRIYIKFMQIPIFLLIKPYVRLVIYLDDIILKASSNEALALAKDTMKLYVLQNLGFLTNVKKSVLQPC